MSDRLKLPSDHRANGVSWLIASVLGFAVSIIAGMYLKDHRAMATARPIVGVLVIPCISVWMAVEWWRLHRIRLRLENERFVFTEGVGAQVVPWTDVSQIEERYLKGRLASLIVTSPRGTIHLPRELSRFDDVRAELEARATKAVWIRATISNLMHR